MDEEYRKEIIQQVKECGQELIARAEDIVPNNLNCITHFSIDVTFSPDNSACPTIEVRTEHIPGTFIERINKEGPYGQRI